MHLVRGQVWTLAEASKPQDRLPVILPNPTGAAASHQYSDCINQVIRMRVDIESAEKKQSTEKELVTSNIAEFLSHVPDCNFSNDLCSKSVLEGRIADFRLRPCLIEPATPDPARSAWEHFLGMQPSRLE